MSGSNIRRIDRDKVKREDLITLKKSMDEDLDSIMRSIENFKTDVDHKLDILVNMLPEEESSKEEVEKITSDQIRYIKILYGKLGEFPPKNLRMMSKKEGSKLIDELKKRLGW